MHSRRQRAAAAPGHCMSPDFPGSAARSQKTTNYTPQPLTFALPGPTCMVESASVCVNRYETVHSRYFVRLSIAAIRMPWRAGRSPSPHFATAARVKPSKRHVRRSVRAVAPSALEARCVREDLHSFGTVRWDLTRQEPSLSA